MKKLLFAVICAATIISCKTSNKDDSATTEEVVKTLELVTTDANFFNKNGNEVTPASYPTDETSRQMLKNQRLVGINKILHKRQLTPTDNQPVVRMNRDTYYSFAVVDVSKGASVTIPEVPEEKYVSVQPVTEDHRIQAMRYGPGTFDLSTHTGDHLYLVIRLDATFTEAEAKEIQDEMYITANSENLFQAEPVNEESFKQVENDLKAKMPGLLKNEGPKAIFGMFTDSRDESKDLFNQEKYEIGAAIGWGGAQMKDNIYEVSGNYAADDCYQLTFEDPGNRAFWSITVYDKNGFMFNDLANFSSDTATPNEDGTYTVSFGCGEGAPNNLEISNPTGFFNLGIRHYQPSERVIKEDYRLLPMMQKK